MRSQAQLQGAAAGAVRPDTEEMLRRLGMGSMKDFNDFQTAIQEMYADAVLRTNLPYRTQFQQAKRASNASLQELDAINSMEKDEKKKEGFQKKLATIKTGVDSIKVPNIQFHGAEKDDQGIIQSVWTSPTEAEGEGYENRAPVALANSMMELDIELKFQAACDELNPLLAELMYYMHTVQGPDGKPLIPWSLQTPMAKGLKGSNKFLLGDEE